jgi:hypothetical protein
MAKSYSFERGKYGVTTGTIIPYARILEGKDPENSDWTNFAPAGFLRCDGTIYNAKKFLALAEIIGIGNNCRFRKPDVILDESNDDLSVGQFQLPDLGSKYISAASANGTYNNLFVLNPITNQLEQRVGVEVDVFLNTGSQIETSYTGNFSVPNIDVIFQPTQNFATTLPSSVGDQYYSDSSMLAHGHFSNAVVVRSGPFNTANDGVGGNDVCVDAPSLDDEGPGYFSNQEESITQSSGTFESVTHGHQLTRSTVSKSVSSNIDNFGLTAEVIKTITNISADNTYKMDNIQHRFILVEYLIKT